MVGLIDHKYLDPFEMKKPQENMKRALRNVKRRVTLLVGGFGNIIAWMTSELISYIGYSRLTGFDALLIDRVVYYKFTIIL